MSHDDESVSSEFEEDGPPLDADEIESDNEAQEDSVRPPACRAARRAARAARRAARAARRAQEDDGPPPHKFFVESNASVFLLPEAEASGDIGYVRNHGVPVNVPNETVCRRLIERDSSEWSLLLRNGQLQAKHVVVSRVVLGAKKDAEPEIGYVWGACLSIDTRAGYDDRYVVRSMPKETYKELFRKIKSDPTMEKSQLLGLAATHENARSINGVVSKLTRVTGPDLPHLAVALKKPPPEKPPKNDEKAPKNEEKPDKKKKREEPPEAEMEEPPAAPKKKKEAGPSGINAAPPADGGAVASKLLSGSVTLEYDLELKGGSVVSLALPAGLAAKSGKATLSLVV